MSAIINPSIVKSVYDKVLAEGRPASEGHFLQGVYAKGDGSQERELSDRFSKIKMEDNEVVESQFMDATQRIRFLRKIRRIHQSH